MENVDKPVFMFMGNGSPENRGCDAITRGTLDTLRLTAFGATFVNAYFLYGDKLTLPRYDSPIENSPVKYPKRWSLKWFVLQVALRFSQNTTANLLFRSVKREISASSAVLSLGGDNYSLDYGIPRRFISMGKFVKKQKTPFIIWGASIGPFSDNPAFEQRIARHLRDEVDLIFLREQESLDYLRSIGVSENVHLSADPAFMMKPQPCEEELGFVLPKDYITLNFSDLMAKYVTGGNMEKWMNICEGIIEMLQTFSIPIILIPHVESDYSFMNSILDKVKSKSAIYMAPNHFNAAQYKWLISKSICNIAARTHATIASFSTSVPTISLGYSIKSKGLNLQMCNSEDFLLYKENISVEALHPIVVRCLNERGNIVEMLERKNSEIREALIRSGNIMLDYIKGMS